LTQFVDYFPINAIGSLRVCGFKPSPHGTKSRGCRPMFLGLRMVKKVVPIG
jgi:hypothetical protein